MPSSQRPPGTYMVIKTLSIAHTSLIKHALSVSSLSFLPSLRFQAQFVLFLFFFFFIFGPAQPPSLSLLPSHDWFVDSRSRAAIGQEADT